MRTLGWIAIGGIGLGAASLSLAFALGGPKLEDHLLDLTLGSRCNGDGTHATANQGERHLAWQDGDEIDLVLPGTVRFRGGEGSDIIVRGAPELLAHVEARRGRLDLTTYHGGYERMPVLAVSFLVMGLACTGFPGTLGFIGQELLVSGAVDAFPVMGFAIVVTSALTGLAVVRMYFSLFCGRREATAASGLRLGLRPREAWAFVALVLTLVGFGVAPRVLVDSRLAASDDILSQRRVAQAAVTPAP